MISKWKPLKEWLRQQCQGNLKRHHSIRRENWNVNHVFKHTHWLKNTTKPRRQCQMKYDDINKKYYCNLLSKWNESQLFIRRHTWRQLAVRRRWRPCNRYLSGAGARQNKARQKSIGMLQGNGEKIIIIVAANGENYGALYEKSIASRRKPTNILRRREWNNCMATK